MNKYNHNNKNTTKAPKPTTLVVSAEENGQELLTFLLAKLKNKSRNNVKSLLSFKAVSIDGRVTAQFNTPLVAGQTVAVATSPQNAIEDNSLPFSIIYEDESIIVIDKPHGLLSIATDKEKNNTAYRIANDYVKRTNPSGRVHIVHRLDRDTSGVLLLAKNEDIKQLLQDNWETATITRGYIAVVEGIPEQKKGTVHTWLKETATHFVYSSDDKSYGQEAITEYEVLRSNQEYSLLRINIKTGRKNQIRVHMKDIGNPIIGDKKYGGTKNPIKRLGLHSNLLELKNPQTGEIMRFEAKAPKGFYSCTSQRENTQT